ncbi:MAG: DUF4388 domain-containing protein [Desulfobacterales bacterium]|nr:DUF4388 domain-containing protein [Desulfobacterales bacterium]
MSLTGNLETFELSALLRMLAYEQRTGRLVIKSETNTVQVFLHDGDIVFATETRKNNRLGELMKENGLISQQVLDECLTLSLKKKERLGKTLVEQGYLSLERLNAFLLKQAENTVYNVLLWGTGKFEYMDAPLNLKGAIEYKLDTMNILLDASRRIEEMGILKKQIPSDAAIPKISGQTGGRGEIKLKADEWRILSLLNGQATVRQIFDKSGFDDFTAYQILNSLISSGRVKVRQPRTLAELEEAVIRQIQGIDAGQFRWAMDNMGLKRSSLLRIALSRIFREAVNENPIRAVAEKEAAKINQSKEEKMALNEIREENQVPYMKDIIELLWQAFNQAG